MTLKTDIKLVCESVLKEHYELKQFMSGFARVEQCNCPICNAARRVLNEIEITGGTDDQIKTN